MLTTDDFAFMKKENVLVAEISDVSPHLMEIYNDETGHSEIGLKVQSLKTGKVATFYRGPNVYDSREHELLYEIYRPTLETQQGIPQTRGMEIHLLND